jgi:hypothetical protein
MSAYVVSRVRPHPSALTEFLKGSNGKSAGG